MPEPTRMLAAIMFTDIVGYTALMGKDSRKALDLVRQSKQIQKPLVEKHRGKWLKEMGDGVMAQFGSAMDAVNCAVEIQRSTKADFDADIRIGIHSGDITIENNDVYGDGVNVASRLESIADPGGIYISESIEKAIRGQSDIQAKYLGEVKLKNVDYDVRTYALQGLGLPKPDLQDEKGIKDRFLAELERRGVARAGIMYILICMLLTLLLPKAHSWLDLPEWSSTIFITILGIGFPISLLLAWRYERSPQGFIRTTSDKSWQNPWNTTQRKPFTGNIIMGGLAIIILILLANPGNRFELNKVESIPGVIINNKSIAVLPFTDMSPEKDQEYLGDGIAEEIINVLTEVSGLKVIGRTSSFSFKGQNIDLKDIGVKLGVGIILEGSVRKSKNKIRITAQLLNAQDGSHIWSETYNRELDDIFVIEDELSRAIVNALKLEISENSASLVKDQTTSMVAYNLYLQGRFFWSKRTEDGIKKSIDFFEQAITEDSLYALAYSGIADAYNVFAWWGFLEPSVAFPKAKAAALKALEINKTLGQGYAGLAFVQTFYEWDWEAAEKNYLQAHNLNPNYATANQWHALYYHSMGDPINAMNEIKKAIKLEPLSLIINFDLSLHYLWQGDHKKAIVQGKKIVEMDPNFYPAHYALYHTYYDMGEKNLAFDHLLLFMAAYYEDTQTLKKEYLNSGWSKAMRLMIPMIEDRSGDLSFTPMRLAEVYVYLNNNEKALDYLDQAYEQRIPRMVFIGMEPIWENLYSEPRFQAILAKMRIPKSHS